MSYKCSIKLSPYHSHIALATWYCLGVPGLCLTIAASLVSNPWHRHHPEFSQQREIVTRIQRSRSTTDTRGRSHCAGRWVVQPPIALPRTCRGDKSRGIHFFSNNDNPNLRESGVPEITTSVRASLDPNPQAEGRWDCVCLQGPGARQQRQRWRGIGFLPRHPYMKGGRTVNEGGSKFNSRTIKLAPY